MALIMASWAAGSGLIGFYQSTVCTGLSGGLSYFQGDNTENPMSASAQISSPPRYLVLAAIAAILTGCASTPPQSAAPTESPASASKLVDTADFTKKAQDDGWTPEVRSGRVLYCKDEAPLGSRFPERTCLDKVAVEQMMLAEEKQRESMQHAYNGVATPP
jgi:hypothetical protein